MESDPLYIQWDRNASSALRGTSDSANVHCLAAQMAAYPILACVGWSLLIFLVQLLDRLVVMRIVNKGSR
jgi:hypothetical protein